MTERYGDSRCEVNARTVVIKIVEEELRPYLVACADFSFAKV